MSSVSSPTLRLHPLAPASLSRTGVLVVALLIGTGPGTSPPAGHAQGLESYRLAATWTDAGDPQRVVAAPSGDVYTVVGGGSGVERRSPGGVVLGLTAAAGVEELAVDDAGSLYATRDHRLVAKYAPSGALVWADRIRGYGPIPTPSGERAPYLTGVAWTPGTSEVTVAYDFGALDGGSEFRVRAYVRGGASRAAFSVQGATDTYGDAGAGSQGVYLLNRTRNQVERYTGGAYAGSTPLPEPIERIAIGPDGAVFALARHRWVYKVASNGSLTAVWDALDPTPDMGAESTATDLDVDAAGKVYVVDPTRRQVRVYEPDPDPAAVPPPPPAPPSLDCQIFPDKFAAPTRLRLGERTKVTLRLDGGCPEVSDQADIVLVVDVSGSMEGDKLAAARSAVQTFVGLMDLTQHQVGLVAFETTARVMVGLTTNPGAIVNAAQSLVALGGTDIAAGIDAALGELSGPNRRPRAKPIIVLMTDGKPTAVTGAAVVAASDRARYMRSPAACRGTMTCAVTLYAIGLGGDVDQDMLRIVATTPELYFYAPQPSELEAVYSLIARRIHATELMKFVRIVDQVPGNMTYVVGSAEPPVSYDAAARTLTWDWRPVPFAGVEMTYWLKPEAVGEWPTNVVATFDGDDGLDQHQAGEFPIPVVVVTTDTPTPRPSATATPTVPPTATATPTVPPTTTASPTSPATPTATLPPTATPPATPRAYRAYIVVVYHNVCFKRYADTVLVLDASTTMLRRDEYGRQKLAAAKAAAREYIAQLSLSPDNHGRHDQAAVVWFNDTAAIEQPLTSDPRALNAALDRIAPVEGSRIDLGLDAGRQALFDPDRRRQANAPVVVLLSDGIPNRTTFEAVFASADRAKAVGAHVFAVGHGLDVQDWALRRVASQPEDYYYSPTTSDLEAIYHEIAGQVICR